MTPAEARQLLSGYATGSLTESERAALLQAALEDQALFNELADEQALKEILDWPGARQRLVAALEPPSRARVWFGLAAAAAVAIVAVVGVVTRRTEPPPQIAQVLKSPETAVINPVQPAVPPPKPVPPKAGPAAVGEELREEKLADQKAEPRGFVATAPPAVTAMRAENAAVAKASGGFAFSYAVRADGFLEIVPAARGFLSVTANDATIFPSGGVAAGTPVRIPIPAEATSVAISFSAIQGVTRTPVRRDETSGTVTDQDPPNGRIAIQLSLPPGTR